MASKSKKKDKKKDEVSLSSSEGEDDNWSELEEEDEDDHQIKKIFAEEILNCDVLDLLPPTPAAHRPPSRASSRLSEASLTLSSRPTPKNLRKGNAGGGSMESKSSPSKSISERMKKKKTSKKRLKEKDICRALGIDIDESELNDMEKDDRIPVDNVIDDILNRGGLGKGVRKGPGEPSTAKTTTTSTDEAKKLSRQYGRLRGKAPLEITAEGRLTVLKDDVMTVRKTKEAVDALIAVLERTKIRLINDDDSLTYTEPPLFVKTRKDVRRRDAKKKEQPPVPTST